jgi:hypothetical protein
MKAKMNSSHAWFSQKDAGDTHGGEGYADPGQSSISFEARPTERVRWEMVMFHSLNIHANMLDFNLVSRPRRIELHYMAQSTSENGMGRSDRRQPVCMLLYTVCSERRNE